MTALLEQLREIVGPKGWTSDADELEPHLTEWRGVYEGRTSMLVRPKSRAEVIAIVKACAAAGVSPDLSNDEMPIKMLYFVIVGAVFLLSVMAVSSVDNIA